MTTYIENGMGGIEKVLFGGVILALVLLMVTLMQPVWRGDEMRAEFISNCEKRGGVLLTSERMFGKNYECASRLDGGQ